MAWGLNKHKHSNAFLKFLWLGNLAWDFLGVKFGPGNLWVLFEALGIFGVLIFAPIRSFLSQIRCNPPPPAPDAVEIFRCSCSQFSFICSVRRLVTRHFKMAAKIVVVDELFKDLQRWGKEASLPGTLNYKYSSDIKLLLFLFCLIPFGFKYSFYVIRQFTLQRDIVVLNWDHFVLQDLS